MRAFRSSPALLSLALLLSLGCDGSSPAAAPDRVPAALAVLEGDGQQAVAGGELALPLAVLVVDVGARPIPGATVRFTVDGGGRLTEASAVSDGQGVARTRWTLGADVSRPQRVEARLEAVPAAEPARFSAVARADAPAALSRTGAEALQGLVGTPLADSLAVEVRDRHGNPVAGVEVVWEVAAGGGSVSPARSTTGAAGIARTRWTLGPRADSAQGVQARVAGMAPVAFRADAATGGVTLLLVRRGGDGQFGAAGGVLADSLRVGLFLPDGRPVAGATVSWGVAEDGGSVSPAVSRTDAAGLAAAAWRLGTAPGPAQATATVDEGTLSFGARVQADAPAAASYVGGGGEGPVGGVLADSLAVRVADRYGNPAAGVEVAWSVVSGGGSLSPARSTTDAAGIARAAWTLGAVADSQAARAVAGTLPAVVFRAAATTRGVPLQLIRGAGNGQTGEVGQPLPEQLRIRLLTPSGEPVQGATVAWVVTAGGGALAQAGTRTDEQGEASAAWTMGRAAGPAQATARVDEGVLSFAATARSGPPAAVRADSGGGQTATRGTVLPAPLVAQVLDRFGNPVPGVLVRWRVTAGGGALEADSARTRADGRARVRWALGLTPGGNRAAAAVEGLNERLFAATATAGTLRLAYETPAVLTLGMHSYQVGVSVRDEAGSPVVGAPVGWTGTGGSALIPAAPRTDWEGIATARWYNFPFYGPIYADAGFEQQSLRFTLPRPPYIPPCRTVEGFAYIGVDTPEPYYVKDTIDVAVDGFASACGEPVDVSISVWDDNGHSDGVVNGGTLRWPLGLEPRVLTIQACPDNVDYATCSEVVIDVQARPASTGTAPP